MRLRYRNLRARRAGRALAPYLAVAALIGVGLVFGERLGDGAPRRPPVPAAPDVIRGVAPGGVVAGRAAVVDGDTIAIRGRRIRFEGIDAFEREQICRSARGDYACGRDAAAALRELIGGARVECRLAGRDRYGRALGICRANGRDLGAALVEAGWALATRADYVAAERAARAARRGAWQGTFEPPAQWRRAHPR